MTKEQGRRETSHHENETSALLGEIAQYANETVQQVIRFTSWLRTYGFRSGLPETLAALEATHEMDICEKDEWLFSLRSIYARTPTEWALFEDLFHRFYFGDRPRLRESRKVDDTDGLLHGQQTKSQEDERPPVAAMNPMPSYSPDAGERYGLRVQSDSLREVEHATKRAVAGLSAPLSRRFVPGPSRRMDLRRTTKAAMRYAGHPLRLKWQRFAPGRPRIVLLLDVSGSMKEYAAFFTTLAWSFLRTRARVQVFLFSTELLRITAALRQRGLRGIMEEALQAGGLRGGTKTGTAIHTLLRRYPGLMSKHTVCLIASDGFDAGHPGELHSAMEQLSQRTARIIWLNPLLARPLYSPTASGMRIALPYLSAFVDVHNGETWTKAVHEGVFYSSFRNDGD